MTNKNKVGRPKLNDKDFHPYSIRVNKKKDEEIKEVMEEAEIPKKSDFLRMSINFFIKHLRRLKE